jgi:hypothetical protein
LFVFLSYSSQYIIRELKSRWISWAGKVACTHIKVWSEKLKKRDHCEDLGVELTP